MESAFSTLDLIIFFGLLIVVMAVGLIAGRKEETSEDYFLAGRQIRWWGVAGSIFGSNVSANHMVGMMGIGFSVGFAQSHFELGAIAGLMLLCYGFLPVYRKLRVYTLSEYLGRRYNEGSRVAYAIIMIIIMAVVQMVPALYIGSRSICVLLGGDFVEKVVGEAGATEIDVNLMYYTLFVVALGAISASYTILGGLKAVVWTDVLQSLLLLAAGLILAYAAFDAIGGWGAMMAADRAAEQKMHLYLPANHEELPWTGVLTGLMIMHFFYWGTNQFIVQRTLGARSDREARLGVILAGFLKLLIPFFAIGAGVAAFYLFRERLDYSPDADTAFTELVKLVIPSGFGLVGLLFAGVIGAILSSIDSMMNSAATIVTVDIYKRYFNPDASDRQMILLGRLSIVAFVVLAALMAVFVIDPNSEENFFLTIVNYQAYLSPGIVVAFFLGMFWKRSTPIAGFVTLLSGVFFSWLVERYDTPLLKLAPTAAAHFGSELNFFHRVVIVILLTVVCHVLVSLLTRRDPEKERLNWTDLGGHDSRRLFYLVLAILVSIGVFALLGGAMYTEIISPVTAAIVASLWTLALFLGAVVRTFNRERASGTAAAATILGDDRLWAGLLCSLAIFMMYYFY